jgi:2-aminoethylphosphonate-pyruvate transaminase
MQAVILAAGMGSRIRDIHTLPKGFITLNKKTLIENAVTQLKKNGIQDILLVTGYGSHYYEALAAELSLSIIYNENYNRYGSLYSLYCARSWTRDAFLLLESDIFFETRAIETIIQDPHSTGIVISGETHSGDEVYVQTNGKKLVNMSKQKNTLDAGAIYGEFVGINKIALRDFQYLINQLESNPMVLQSGNYEEDGLVMLAKDREVTCVKLPDLIWGEIDNSVHLERAKKLYNLIDKKEICV